MEQPKNKIGLLSMISISTTGIIGSGWLFSSYLGAKTAGAGVYISWILALVFFMLMALALAEIVTAYPLRGIIGRMGAISHNKYFGAIFSFAIWLDLIGTIPGEAQASVQYLAGISPKMTKYLMLDGNLSNKGLLLTLGFLLVYWIINMFGIKLFAKINNSIAIIKIVLPVFIALTILGASFTPANFTAFHGNFIPYGYNSIILAMTSTGMIYSLNGFQMCASFASEVKNPRLNLPLGMIISLVLSFIIYMVLQTSFIGAMDNNQLITQGWHSLNFNSPFAQISTLLGLNVITALLYADACISPSGTGISYVGSGSRVLYSLASEKQMPSFFAVLNTKYNVETRAMILNFAIAAVFLYLFQSWAVLINFITALIVLMYMVIPISLLGFRNGKNEKIDSFKLPFATFFCYILFLVQSLLFVFIGAKDMLNLTLVMTALIVIFIFLNVKDQSKYTLKQVAAVSFPFIIYLWLCSILIIVGPTVYGGKNYISTEVFYSVYIIISLFSFYYFTCKNFVSKCQEIREVDNIPVPEKTPVDPAQSEVPIIAAPPAKKIVKSNVMFSYE